MSDKEYLYQVSAAIIAVTDSAARYMQKNPNAKYKDGHGIDRPFSLALDIARKQAVAMRAVADELETG